MCNARIAPSPKKRSSSRRQQWIESLPFGACLYCIIVRPGFLLTVHCGSRGLSDSPRPIMPPTCKYMYFSSAYSPNVASSQILPFTAEIRGLGYAYVEQDAFVRLAGFFWIRGLWTGSCMPSAVHVSCHTSGRAVPTPNGIVVAISVCIKVQERRGQLNRR